MFLGEVSGNTKATSCLLAHFWIPVDVGKYSSEVVSPVRQYTKGIFEEVMPSVSV